MSVDAPSDLPVDYLSEAAMRVTQEDRGFVGYWLKQYRTLNALSEKELSRKLNVRKYRLAVLALCRSPGDETFDDDVAFIAHSTEVDPVVLAEILRIALDAEVPVG